MGERNTPEGISGPTLSIAQEGSGMQREIMRGFEDLRGGAPKGKKAARWANRVSLGLTTPNERCLMGRQWRKVEERGRKWSSWRNPISGVNP